MRRNPDSDVLDERTRGILMAVVHSFISTAEPVGSRTISKRYDFGLSPATIRNVMSDLEELGLLEQPHTSAGRVPTDQGYRLYVNYLQDMKRLEQELSQEESALIVQRFAPYHGEIDEIVAEASRLLSEVSRYAGIVLRKFSTTVFKRIEFVKIRGLQVLCIFVMQSGMVQNKFIMLDEVLTQDELHRISNYLNQEFSGLPLTKIREQVLERMAEDKVQYDVLLQQAMQIGEKTFNDSMTDDGDIYVGGTVNIIEQPEFLVNIDRMKDLFKAFEEKSHLISILDRCLDEAGVNVILGSETPFPNMHDYSFVTHPYSYDDQTVGVLGVIGPKRMVYPRVMAIVHYTAHLVSKILTQG
jgi:heat-inducible transcriptional repressor